MPRLQLELPECFSFSTELSLYTSHINQGGHLDNAQLLALYSEVRRRYFVALGYTEANVEGLITTVTDLAVIYRAEAFVGDTLVFEVAACDFNNYGCDLLWQARDQRSGREIARGKSGFVFLQAGTRRPAPMPLQFRERASAIAPEKA